MVYLSLILFLVLPPEKDKVSFHLTLNFINMKNLKKLSREELKTISGGRAADFACYCNGTYLGEYSTVSSCVNACDLKTSA
jgi:hypothetical protein